MAATYTYSSPDADTITTEIPDRMQQAKRWLLWKLEPNPEPGKKPRKVPYYTSGARRFGKLDSPADISRFDTLANSLAAYASGGYAGIGFALGPDGEGYWCGIDFDNFAAHPNLEVLAEHLPGYVERSPSGTGVHAIGYGPTIRSMGSNESGIEVYGAGRYFTVTGEAIGGDIEDLSAFVAEHLVALHRAGMPQQPDAKPAEQADPRTVRDLRSALASMRADDRDVWIRMGHALKTLGDQGRGLWIEWSQTSEKYDAQDAARVWESFQPSATDYRAVFALAQQQGWANTAGGQRRERRQAAAAGGGDVVDMDQERQKRKPKQPKTSDGPAPEPQGMLAHFQPLGYDGDQFFFFTARGKQIRALSASKLGKKIELLTLAPLEWWEREYSGDQGFSGRAVEMAANHLISQCYGKGVFCPDSRRGRGVWVDMKDSIRRIVIHAGDRLYIDGTETPLIQTETTHVYEQGEAIAISMRDPLSVAETKPFVEFCKAINWERRVYGMLFAGWTVAAIASGALVWRPHGLVTGPKGCGKSWDMHVIATMLGSFRLTATGGSSAAGLRQSLRSDALPVLFDEAEGDSGTAQQNVTAVLGLMRHSSASLDAKVLKGGADGRASSYNVRSCFMLAAIRDPIIQAADRSRITIFSLKKATAESAEHWKNHLRPLSNTLMSPSYAERFRGRVFSRMDDLLDSIEVFSTVCAKKFGDQRMGDQLGAMLGGVWLLTQDGVPTADEATNRVNRMNWEDQTELLTESSDEDSCLQAILGAHIRVDGGDWHGDATVGELIDEILSPYVAHRPFTVEEAVRALSMYGLKVEVGTSPAFLVSNKNAMLGRKIMSGTPWPVGWGKLLARIEGAERFDKMRIGGHQSRGVKIKIDWV